MEIEINYQKPKIFHVDINVNQSNAHFKKTKHQLEQKGWLIKTCNTWTRKG